LGPDTIGGTTAKVKQRRQDVKRRIARGLTQKKIAKQLDVSHRTVQRDVRAIKDQIMKEIKEEPIEKILFELTANMESISEEYWTMYHDETASDQVQLGALNSLKDLITSKIKTLQRLGIVREEPLEVHQKIEQNNLEGALEELRDEIEETNIDEIDPELEDKSIKEMEERKSENE